jgi:glycosyltransferase involved in cell wall biosynthesis
MRPPFAPGQVTAVIPAHANNIYDRLALRAVDSVMSQTRPADALSVAMDYGHAGAAATRNRAVTGVRTEWSAFLDSDDYWWPGHLDTLLRAAEESGADVIYPWFEVTGPDPSRCFDPLAQFFGKPFDADVLRTQNYVPVTVLARTELVLSVGGFQEREGTANPADEHELWLKLLDAGATFHHVPERSWSWWWHQGNTSGSGARW